MKLTFQGLNHSRHQGYFLIECDDSDKLKKIETLLKVAEDVDVVSGNDEWWIDCVYNKPMHDKDSIRKLWKKIKWMI